MANSRGNLTLNKWHFKLGIMPVSFAHHGYMVHFGIFKLLKFPSEGAIFVKSDYKGFWLRKTIQWRGFEFSAYIDYWQRLKKLLLWKSLDAGAIPQPTKFHEFLKSITGKYFDYK